LGQKDYLPILAQIAGLSLDGLVVRQCITKGAFAELRAACVRRGGDLTGEFLDLALRADGPTQSKEKARFERPDCGERLR
jgi:hypothetical protein